EQTEKVEQTDQAKQTQAQAQVEQIKEDEKKDEKKDEIKKDEIKKDQITIIEIGTIKKEIDGIMNVKASLVNSLIDEYNKQTFIVKYEQIRPDRYFTDERMLKINRIRKDKELWDRIQNNEVLRFLFSNKSKSEITSKVLEDTVESFPDTSLLSKKIQAFESEINTKISELDSLKEQIKNDVESFISNKLAEIENIKPQNNDDIQNKLSEIEYKVDNLAEIKNRLDKLTEIENRLSGLEMLSNNDNTYIQNDHSDLISEIEVIKINIKDLSKEIENIKNNMQDTGIDRDQIIEIIDRRLVNHDANIEVNINAIKQEILEQIRKELKDEIQQSIDQIKTNMTQSTGISHSAEIRTPFDSVDESIDKNDKNINEDKNKSKKENKKKMNINLGNIFNNEKFNLIAAGVGVTLLIVVILVKFIHQG
ncbi:MAG: hypothetical protein QXV17_08905, partial [Candidatus Micrarchaeaceae archaeon]